MSTPATATKVGAFVVVMAAASFGIYTFIVKDVVKGEGYTVYVKMKDASGIARRSEVLVAGIPVGSVQDIKLDDDGEAKIAVKVRGDVPLYDDAAAAKASNSFLGGYYIKFIQGTEGRPTLHDGDFVPSTIEGASTGEILRNVRDISQDVKKVTKSLANSVGTKKGEQNIKQTLQNLEDITKELKGLVRENRQSINNIVKNVERITADGQPKVDRILTNVEKATSDVRLMLAKTEGDKPGDVRQFIDKLNSSADKLDRSLGNVEDITTDVNEGKGTVGRLVKDEHLIDEVEGVAEGVGEIVGGISRLKLVVGLRTDYEFLSNTIKSYVSLRIQPREDKYYLIQIINNPKGLTTFEQVDVDTTNPNDPPHYREVRTVTTNAFRFSLMFAKRFGPITGRFGIIESTGGFGIDLNFLDDRFEMRNDVFGFGEVVLPRVRSSIGYEFLNRVSLLGGVDDILSGTRRDYFIGLQLRFTDDDLKSVLPFAPAGAL